MSVYKTYKFQELSKLSGKLNGELRLGHDPSRGYDHLIGKTLVFTLPAAATVTFTPGTNAYALTFTEFKTQVEAAVAGLKVYADGKETVLIETTPSLGVAITAASTALPSLGGDASGMTSFIYSYPPGNAAAVAPHWVQTFFADGHYVLLVKE